MAPSSWEGVLVQRHGKTAPQEAPRVPGVGWLVRIGVLRLGRLVPQRRCASTLAPFPSPRDRSLSWLRHGIAGLARISAGPTQSTCDGESGNIRIVTETTGLYEARLWNALCELPAAYNTCRASLSLLSYVAVSVSAGSVVQRSVCVFVFSLRLNSRPNAEPQIPFFGSLV